jgi:hypothetical protein
MAGPDRLTTSRFAPLWVLILALLSFWVGLAELPVQDRDEARYAQASRQMAETGDWVDIRFQTAARHVKPVGVYWMQAAVLEATGQTGTNDIRVHRIPSYLAGAFAALALIWAGTPLVGRRAAVLGGVMLATVYMLSAEARTAKTDATLLLTIILAMGAMGRAWLGQAKGWAVPAVFWTALAAGILVKGPVILLPVVTAAAWVSAKDRSLSWLRALRPLPGIGWMLLLTLPWFIAIMIRTEGAFLMASIGGDLAEKLAATGEHSGIPPGFYMLTVWATLWPWTLLLPLALVTGLGDAKDPRGRVPPGLDRAHMGRVRGGLDQAHPLHAADLPRAPAAGRGASGEAHRRGARVPGMGRASRDGRVRHRHARLRDPRHRRAGRVRRRRPPVEHARRPRPDGFAAILAVVAFYQGAAMRGTVALALAGIAMAWTLTAASLPQAREFWITPRMAEAMETLSCLATPPSITLVQAETKSHELLRRVVLGVDLGIGAQDRVRAEHEIARVAVHFVSPLAVHDVVGCRPDRHPLVGHVGEVDEEVRRQRALAGR